MRVLSLFDGISAGMLALQRAGIPVTSYYASEIDKYAIKISQKNFPEIIQLGDVNNWKSWDIGDIDLLIGGSPCTNLSVSGNGLGLDGPQSGLLYRFIDVLYKYRPRYFLLENVPMKSVWKNTISELVGLQPIEINSSLVSAQSRRRLYWTNIPITSLLRDKKILLKDILESGYVNRDKSYCLDANYFKGGIVRNLHKSRRQGVMEGCMQVAEADLNGHDIIKRVYSIDGKSPTIKAQSGGNLEPKILVDDFHWRKLTPIECERLQTFPDNYTEGVSNTQRYKMLGNSWTVDVISFIFKEIKKEKNILSSFSNVQKEKQV